MPSFFWSIVHRVRAMSIAKTRQWMCVCVCGNHKTIRTSMCFFPLSSIFCFAANNNQNSERSGIIGKSTGKTLLFMWSMRFFFRTTPCVFLCVWVVTFLLFTKTFHTCAYMFTLNPSLPSSFCLSLSLSLCSLIFSQFSFSFISPVALDLSSHARGRSHRLDAATVMCVVWWHSLARKKLQSLKNARISNCATEKAQYLSGRPSGRQCAQLHWPLVYIL